MGPSGGQRVLRIIAQPLLIGLLALPRIIQSDGVLVLGYAWAIAWKLPHQVAAP